LPFRILLGFTKATLAVLVIVLTLSNIALPLAVTMASGAYAVVAAVAETLFAAPSLLKRQASNAAKTLAAKEAELVATQAERKTLREAAAKVESKAAKEVAAKQAEVIAAKSARKAAEDTVEKVTKNAAKDLAAKEAELIIIRREKAVVGEAVSRAVNRVGARIKKMLAADIGAMAGEAVPYIGAFVIVGSITYDVDQSCEMMKDLRDLERTFVPEPIDPSEVCGMRVPTALEIWESAKTAPSAAMTAAYEALPDFQWQAGWDDMIENLPDPEAIGAWVAATSELLPEFYWQEGWDDLRATVSKATGLGAGQ